MYYSEKKLNGIYILIIINFVVFFIFNILLSSNFIKNFYTFGLVPLLFIKKGFLWQPFTYFFLHGNFSHIFWNMFALFMFGMPLEVLWGKKKFIIFYMISGVITGIIAGIIYYFIGMGNIPMVGASGAIYAILIGFALTFPDELILLFFIFPIKAKYTPVVFAIIDLLLGIGTSTHIAHFAHLTGLAVGYVVYLFMFKQNYSFKRGYIKNKNFIRDRKIKKNRLSEDEQFFIHQSLYKLKNNIYFSDFEIEKLRHIMFKIGDTIVACGPEEFDPNSFKCLKCLYLPYCILREIKKRRLY